MYEAEEVLDIIIKARRDVAEVLQLCVKTSDFPVATIAAQSPAALRRRLDPVRLARRDQLDAEFV